MKYLKYKINSFIIAEGYSTIIMNDKEFYKLINENFTVKRKAIIYQFNGYLFLMDNQSRILVQCGE